MIKDQKANSHECPLSSAAKFNSCHGEFFLLISKKFILSLTFMPKISLESVFYSLS